MDYPEKQNIERHLRKKYKDWSGDKIEAEGRRIWSQYKEANKKLLEQREKFEKESFEKSIDIELLNNLLDSPPED